MSDLESATRLIMLVKRHGAACTEIAIRWNEADGKRLRFITDGCPPESSGYEVLVADAMQLCNAVVTRVQQDIVPALLPLLSDVLGSRLIKIWNQIERGSKDARRRWNSEWADELRETQQQLIAATDRARNELAASPDIEKEADWTLERLIGWCSRLPGLELLADARALMPPTWSDSRELDDAIDVSKGALLLPHVDRDRVTVGMINTEIERCLAEAEAQCRHLLVALSAGVFKTMESTAQTDIAVTLRQIGTQQSALRSSMRGVAPFDMGAVLRTLREEAKALDRLAMRFRVVRERPSSLASPAGDIGSTTPGRDSSYQIAAAPAGKKGTRWQDAADRALAHLNRNPWPGQNALAALVGCSTSTMKKAVGRTRELTEIRDAHETSKKGGSVRTRRSSGYEPRVVDHEPTDVDEAARRAAALDRLVECARPSERPKLFAELQARSTADLEELMSALTLPT